MEQNLNNSQSDSMNRDKNRKSFQNDPTRSSRPRRVHFRRPRFRDKNINLIHLLPNVLTSLNIACGVAAVLFVLDKKFEIAAMLILLAVFFDMIDGKVARLVGAASPFGVQLDSLADLISFGVAPPIMIHAMLYKDMNRLGASLVLIYALCSALRLARYNIQAMGSKKKREFFVGLPCPVPGCFLAALVLASLEYGFPLDNAYSRIALHIVMICLSGLMVSTIPYPDLAARKVEKKNIYQYNVFIVLILCVAVLRFKAVLLALTLAFILMGPIIAIRNEIKRRTNPDEILENTENLTPETTVEDHH